MPRPSDVLISNELYLNIVSMCFSAEKLGGLRASEGDQRDELMIRNKSVKVKGAAKAKRIRDLALDFNFSPSNGKRCS